MATSNVTEYRTYGAAILQRLRSISIPSALKAPVAQFKKVHGDYEAAAALVDKARILRDRALDAVGEADEAPHPRLADAHRGQGCRG